MSDDEAARPHEPEPEPADGQRSRRRWWPVVVSGIAVVAVVTLAATVLTGVFSKDKADDKAHIAGTDLPPLDPDMRYTFEDLEDGDASEPSKTSQQYRDAFWEHLHERFPGLQNHAIVEPEYADSEELETMLGREVDGADLVRTMSGLAEWRYDNKEKTASTFERNTGYKRPYFQLSGTAANNLPDYTQFPDREYADGLSLNVYPADSFAPGMSCEDPFSGVELMDCCDSGQIECDSHTADNGDKVMTAQRVEMADDDGEQVKHRQTNTVALIRESDGVGIVVSDESPINRGEEDTYDRDTEEPLPLDDPDDATPALSADDLTELAQALPEKPVK